MSLNEILSSKQLRAVLAKRLNDQGVLYLAPCIVLLGLRMLALVLAAIAAISATLARSCVFFETGVTELIKRLTERHASRYWWSLMSELLGIVVGFLWFVWLINGALSLTLVSISLFVAERSSRSAWALGNDGTFQADEAPAARPMRSRSLSNWFGLQTNV